MNYQKFLEYISLMAQAHQEKVGPTGTAWRTLPSGEKNPFFIHPLWSALTLLHESALLETIRYPGAQALLFHDMLEDTTAPLPEDISDEVRGLIHEMTFKDFDDEKAMLPQKPPLIQLLKLYDKTASLYDGALVEEKKPEFLALTEELAKTIEKEYGALNIIFLARTLIAKNRSQ